MDQETVTYTTTKGMYVGASVRMATMEPPSEQNKAFYGKDVKAKDILCTPGAVEVPEDSQVCVEKKRIVKKESFSHGATCALRIRA